MLTSLRCPLQLFANVSNMEKKLAAQENISAFQAGWRKHMTAYYYFWPRQLVASVAWVCNDFAFYGNKLQQNVFITLLYPTVVCSAIAPTREHVVRTNALNVCRPPRTRSSSGQCSTTSLLS